ncbi:MAG: hypothetical protein ACPGVO_17380, partial [Spirulinaceae cyanobacterium]
MTTIVSTFELLVKRIAPQQVLPVPVQPVARRVVQGYFLTITNLESESIFFGIEYFVNSLENNADRTLISEDDNRNIDQLADAFSDNQELQNFNGWDSFLS